MGEFTGNIGHLDGIESPWGPAGGVCKTIEDVEAMARTGVGWIEAGSYTLEARLGNAVDPERPEPGGRFTVYHHNPETGETGNSLGMPNKGIEVVQGEIPEMVRLAEAVGKKLVVNVAPVTASPLEETRELIARSYEAGAHAVLLNAGCPNIVIQDGGRHELLSRNALAMSKLLLDIRDVVARYQPIFLRVSPQLSREARHDLCFGLNLARRTVSAVFTPNTWPDFMPTDVQGRAVPLGYQQGTGGLSGPAVADPAAEETQLIGDQLHIMDTRIDVVSSAGIMNARELKRRLDLGAVAAAGTTFYYESADWQRDTARLLEGLAQWEETDE